MASKRSRNTASTKADRFGGLEAIEPRFLAIYASDPDSIYSDGAFSSEDAWFDEGWDMYVSRSVEGVAAPLHAHGFFEVNECMFGEIVYETIDGARHLVPGEAILTPPGTAHRIIVTDTDSLAVNIGIRKNGFLSSFRDIWGSHDPVGAYFHNALYTERCGILTMESESVELDRLIALRIHALQREPGRFGKESSRALLQSLLWGLLASVRLEQLPGEDPTMEGMRGYLMEHLADARLADMARIFGYSLPHLCRKWKEYFGVGFSEMLASLRMSSAENLLMTSDLSISRIAASVGYSQDSYFIRRFKEAYGTTPHRYRVQGRGNA